MGRPRKRSHQKTESEQDAAPAAGAARDVPPGSLRRWLARNRSDLRFLLVFGLCMALYYAATLTSPVREGFFPSYLRLNARVSGAILGVVGQDVTVAGQSLISDRGPSIQVERGCDAVAPSALFVAAVLASPVPLLSRAYAAVAGTILLMLLNVIRVVSLYLVRLYWPRAFDTMHLDVWQALFIFLALLIWAVWASRASKTHASRQHAAA
ncbi:MAG: hypothetical protein ACE5FC_11005 [Myxococcota bacterium]